MSLHRIGSSRITSRLLVLSLAFSLGFGTTAAWSQATLSATLAGLVTDEQNAAVAAAEVRIVDSATDRTQTTLTNNTGR